MNASTALQTVTRRAGAVPGGQGVAAHYGSPAGELAVCVQAVGLADRSDLSKLEVLGPPGAVSELVRRAAGAPVAARGYVLADGACWCAASAERVIVLGEPADGARLEAIRAVAPAGVQLVDRTPDWSAIALVGRATLHTLAALGALANPRLAAPFGEATVARERVELLLQSDRRALMLVDPVGAAAVWGAIEEAGRAFGLSCVGGEAVRRFELLERRLDRAPLWLAG